MLFNEDNSRFFFNPVTANPSVKGTSRKRAAPYVER